MARQPAKPKTGSPPAKAGGAWARLHGHPHVFFLKGLALLMVTNTVMRLIFLGYNAFGGWDFAWGDVPLALLVGLRFDFATVAIFNGVVLLLLLLPVLHGPRARKVLCWLLLLSHLPVMFVNGVDVVYYGFASKRLSHEFFSGGTEAANFDLKDVAPYWWLILLVLAVGGWQLWMLLRAAGKVKPLQGGAGVKAWAWTVPVLAAGLLFLGFRGGWQKRPLRPASAFVTNSVFLANVSLNSAYTIVQSTEIGNEAAVDLMPMPEALALTQALVKNDFDGPFDHPDYPLLRGTRFDEPERKLNVVILVVESLNAAKVGWIKGKPLAESLTPNLDTLARHARCYPHFFSNGARSVQSLPAILNSTPDIFERPLIGSSFETNQQWGIGNMLLHRGYHTSFVCGGPNGTLGFDAFSKASGFTHYYGAGDYSGPGADLAGNWGLHDRVTLDWLQTLQAEFPKPFLNLWFSISNHHPFDLPADCPDEIKALDISPMDKTVRYTDWALGNYFQWALRQPWAANTVFVLTGDHCFYFEEDPDRGDVQNFHVPLMLMGPGIAPGTDGRVGSHISIMPTLIEVLRLHTRYSGMGVSMLSEQNEPYGITGLMGLLTLVRKGVYVGSNLDKVVNGYRLHGDAWDIDPALPDAEEGREMERMLKAIYQVSNHLRRHNKQNLPKGME